MKIFDENGNQLDHTDLNHAVIENKNGDGFFIPSVWVGIEDLITRAEDTLEGEELEAMVQELKADPEAYAGEFSDAFNSCESMMEDFWYCADAVLENIETN